MYILKFAKLIFSLQDNFSVKNRETEVKLFKLASNYQVSCQNC